MIGNIYVNVYISRIIDDLNTVFNASIFYNFLSSSLMICLIGFQITVKVNTFDLFKYFIFLITSLSQIFMTCYFGEKLIDSVKNSLFLFCFNILFINLFYRVKKSVFLFIIKIGFKEHVLIKKC